MTSNNNPSTDDLLKILTINFNGLKTLKNELEKYVVTRETDLVRNCYELELENQKLNEKCLLQAKLQQYEAISEPNEGNDIESLLLKLNQEVNSNIKELAVQTNVNRSTRDMELLKYKELYEKCKGDLEKFSLKVSNESFESKLKEYKSVCERNDFIRKESFRNLYEIAKVSKTKLEEQQLISSKMMDGMRPFIESQRVKLIELKKILCANGLNRENKLYESLLKLAKEETTLFNNLCQYTNKKTKEKKISNLD